MAILYLQSDEINPNVLSTSGTFLYMRNAIWIFVLGWIITVNRQYHVNTQHFHYIKQLPDVIFIRISVEKKIKLYLPKLNTSFTYE